VTLPLRDALDQCRRHADVLRSALADLPERFDPAAVLEADSPLLRTVDQFVLRFIKLQDTLGEHVLRAFATEVLAEPLNDSPLIDVLVRLERYGFLDVNAWARWRALRNSLTREYPEHPEIRAALLGQARQAATALAPLVDRLAARLAA
jgi:hypothetical protein